MKILFIYVIVSLLCETTLGAKDHSKLLRNAYSKIGESEISTTTTTTTAATTTTTTTSTITTSSSNATTTLSTGPARELLRSAYSKTGESDISTTAKTTTAEATTTTTNTTTATTNANTTLSSGPAGITTGQEQEKEPSKGSVAGENKKKSLDYSHIQKNKILNYNQLHINETDLGKFTLIRTERGNR